MKTAAFHLLSRLKSERSFAVTTAAHLRPVAVRFLGSSSSRISWSPFSKTVADNVRRVTLLRQCPNMATTRTRQIRFLATGGSRPDPFARRPNQKCDPYGQGGKPLALADAQKLLTTVDQEWKLDLGTSVEEVKNSDGEGETGESDGSSIIPVAVYREFYHKDFLDGATFLKNVAAVAQMNSHFPTLRLERRIVPRRKEWKVITTVECRTKVLQGLSHHDFFLAMLIDVELQRPEIKSLCLPDEAETST